MRYLDRVPNANPALGLSRFDLPRWLLPNLTFPETGCVISIWMAMQMISQSPLGTQYTTSYIIGVIFLMMLTRNIAVIASVVLALGIFLRIAYPISSWEDQAWLQWYSISSLATGHNLFMKSPWVGMSMAAYLPQGDLFGGLFMALGIQKYWYVWQFIDPLLYVIPVVVAPCAATLAVFVGLVWYWPFADYTNAGGNLEINLAMLVAAVAAYRHGRKTAAIVFFAFAAMLRQPSVTIIPFVLLMLWVDRDWARIKLFAALVFLFGGIYILLDPYGAYLYLFRIYEVVQQSFFNAHKGLIGNISVSGIPRALGIPDEVPWNRWKGIYLPLTGLGILGLLVAAWRSKKRDSMLFFTLMAPTFVYILARGYAEVHYVVATGFPFLALAGPAERSRHSLEKYLTGGMACLILWIGVTPLAIFALGQAGRLLACFNAEPVLPVSRTILVGADGVVVPIPNPDGTDAHRPFLWLNQGLQFDFAEPVLPEEVRLTGDHVQVQNVKGIDILWATRTEMRGIIWSGTVEYSPDGRTFQTPREFSNRLIYEAYPVTIKLPKTSERVRALRLRAKQLYVNYDQWFVGNIVFLGNR